MMPSLTVRMPVYNSEKYVAEAIESILCQSFTEFELLIINDYSTDTTPAIITSYADKRIRLINNECNPGLTKSLNKVLALSQGEYIARMDADDIALPERLRRQVDFMEHSPEVDVCGSWYEFFGDRKKIVKPPIEHQKIRDTLFF